VHLEIERKYLLRALPALPRVNDVLEIEQGYIPGDTLVERLRRERHRDGIVKFFRTIKLGSGVERVEIEDETDQRTFEHLWVLTEGRRLTKRRYLAPNGTDVWEVDEFTDRDLVLAELEIDHADARIVMPEWLTPVLVREVTDEKAYTNRSLAR
jgi:CYTH domain-containing protein